MTFLVVATIVIWAVVGIILAIAIRYIEGGK